MRALEFLAERWTPHTVRDYFDSQINNRITTRDFTVSRPFPDCVMFEFKTVPDLTRAFFRMAEYYEGNRYRGDPSRDVDITDFLDRFVDREGEVDYFKFWDGFNITDRAFRAWHRQAGRLAQAENVVVKRLLRMPDSRPWCVIGIAGGDPATRDHEYFHALYYLRTDYRREVDRLMSQFRSTPDYRAMVKTLRDRLGYSQHIDEEIAAYLTTGSQMRMVFGVRPQAWQRQFRSLFQQQLDANK